MLINIKHLNKIISKIVILLSWDAIICDLDGTLKKLIKIKSKKINSFILFLKTLHSNTYY